MSKKAPLSICMIVKNEEIQLEDTLQSIRDYVEEIVIVDTGSTDRSPEIAKKYADKWELFTDCNNPETGLIEDFSMARNKSFSLATKKWRSWIDEDHILNPQDFNTLIEQYDHYTQDVMILLKYEYSYADLEYKIPTMIHYRERLVNNYGKNFQWVSPVHETLFPLNATNLLTFRHESPIYSHRRSPKKTIESGRNLRILKKHYQKVGDEDVRNLYYLGLEYANNNLLNESNEFLTKYVAKSGWPDEKCLAFLKMADNYFFQNKLDESISAALQASTVKESWGESYFSIARGFYFKAQQGGITEMENWQKCAHFAKLGLSQPPTQTVLFVNPLDRNVEIHRYLNMALSKLGDIKGALESVEIGLKTYPEDGQFINNKKWYVKHLSRININQELGKMIEAKSIDQTTYDNVMKILDGNPIVPASLPAPIANNSLNDKVWEEVKNSKKKLSDCYWDGEKIVKKLSHKKKKNKQPLDIVFYVGNSLKPFNPITIKKDGPIGGSELMEAQLASGLSQLGHNVRVYNDPGQTEGLYDGVKYIKTEKFNNLECDVLVVSRFCNMLDDTYHIKAKLKLLHCHDVVAINATHRNLLNADRLIALSNWHKKYLMNAHNLGNDHILVSRNGVDLNKYKNKNIKRDPFKMICSSSPDRYLDILLKDDVWKEIKKRVPQASIHIFYGFENWRILSQNNSDQLNKIDRLMNRMEELKSEGVVYRGKVTQNELANEMLSASIYCYPTWFEETYCINCADATVAGMKTVSSSIAALNETVGERGILIDGDPYSSEYQKTFVEQTVKALKETSDEERVALIKYGEDHFGLEKLYKEWETMFFNLLEEKKINPIIQYQSTPEYR